MFSIFAVFTDVVECVLYIYHFLNKVTWFLKVVP